MDPHADFYELCDDNIRPFQYRGFKIRAKKKGYEFQGNWYPYACTLYNGYQVCFSTAQGCKEFIDNMIQRDDYYDNI